MAIVFAAAGTLLALFSIVAAHVALRVWRSNSAVYDLNRAITGDFSRAARGRILPLIRSSTDFRVNHFVGPTLDKNGKVVNWERAGSLSDEAVDGVLTRQQ
jgi:hypothetical protein